MRIPALMAMTIVLALLGGCRKDMQAPVPQAADMTGAPDPDRDPYLAMNILLVRNACSNCHAADYPRVGPAMKDVAVLYAADSAARTRLAGEIINGTRGKWGEAAMPPQHQVSASAAGELVTAILALGGAKAPGNK
jgi:cytochrome c